MRNIYNIYELLENQKGVFVDCQFETDVSSYNIAGGLVITGPFDVNILEQSINAVVKKHGTLRTCFQVIADIPKQVIHDQIDFKLKYEDLSSLSIEERELMIKELDFENSFKVFDLKKAPLFRSTVVKIEEAKHILFLSFHHIISDGWSIEVFKNEFIENYNRIKNNENSEYENGSSQYIDFVLKENKKLESGSYEEQRKYWETNLKNASPLVLETDFSPEEVSIVSKEFRFSFGSDRLTQIKKYCRKQKCSVFMFLLAAFKVLLHQYTEAEDITITSPLSNRSHSDFENTIGYFVNSVPLRDYVSDEMHFSSLLKHVKKTFIGAYKNIGFPNNMIFRQLGMNKKTKNNDSFSDVSLGFDVITSDSDIYFSDDLKVEGFESEFASVPGKINLLFIESKGELLGTAQYNKDLYKLETIQRMVRHFENLLQSIITNDDVLVGSLSLCDKEELQKVLCDFNRPPVPYANEKPVHVLIEDQVEKNPDKTAVIFENSSLTFKELNDKANELAAFLVKKGVGQRSFVPVLMEKSMDLIVAFLAVMKAGAGFVPIDIFWPNDRINNVLRRIDSPIAIVNKNTPLDQDSFCTPMYRLDYNTLNSPSCKNLDINVDLMDPLYVIFTSGSTGEPKGAINIHKGIINRFLYMIKRYGCDDTDVILMTSNHVFDAAVWQLFWPLINGTKTIIPSPAKGIDLDNIISLIEKHKVTVTDFVPSVFNLLVGILEDSPALIDKLKTLRQLLIGGEAMRPYYMYKFKSFLPNVSITNTYGPAETSIGTVFFELPNEYTDPIPIGYPIDNVLALILDANGKPVPIGVPGELYLGGSCVGLGYFNDKERTDKVFLKPDIEGYDQGIFYKTGDKARFRPDGIIEFLGRIDFQVKLHGVRIELGEIENKILEFDGVKEVVVVDKESRQGDKFLCAYVVQASVFDIEDLRNFISSNLPHAMVPSFFCQVDIIPLTLNGKVDRRALPDPELDTLDARDIEPPANELESRMLKVWQMVLNSSSLGVTDNFFNIGGHSLNAISLVSKINKEFSIQMPLMKVFETPSIRELCAFVDNSESVTLEKIKKVEKKDCYDVSSAQKRLFALQQLDLSDVSYNMTGGLVFTGKVDPQKIEAILLQLIKRHESLRTSFKVFDGRVVQVVQDSIDFTLRQFEISEETLHDEVNKFVTPFDLEKDPLLRSVLFKVDSSKYVLILDLHHIIVDGLSTDIILTEFLELYKGNELTPLDIQYKDFAAWQNDFFQSDKIKAQEDFWLNQFNHDVPVLNLPSDYPRPVVLSTEGSVLKFSFDKQQLDELKRFAQDKGVTLFILLMSVYSVLLSRYTGQDDLVIGFPIAGRKNSQLDSVVGMFVNPLAVRINSDWSLPFANFLDAVKDSILKAFENQDYQFDMLVNKLNLVRDTSRNPLFDTMFDFQYNENVDVLNFSSDDINIEQFRFFEGATAKFDISFTGYELKDGIDFEVEYCTKLFKEATVARLAESFKMICQAITEKSGSTLGNIPVLSKKDLTLLQSYNRTSFLFPKDMLFHQIFEEAVISSSDSVAVICDGKRITYYELNQKANQVARRLLDLGITVNDRVGIISERSIEMVIGVLGVLKSGGSFVPIDVSYPDERISYILDNSEVSVVLYNGDVTNSIISHLNCVDLSNSEIYTGSADNLNVDISPINTAYVIYTSGSTGTPKGVMVSHRNVVNVTFGWQKEYALDTFKVNLLQMARFSFDVCTGDIARTFISKGTMIICSDEVKLTFSALYDIIKTHKVSIFESTPALIVPFMNYLHDNSLSIDSLQLLILGSDVLHFKDYNTILSNFPGNFRVVNSYGVTEATIDSSYFEGKYQSNSGAVPIGKPLPNTSYYILDKVGNLIPPGVFGELCIGGEGVSLGYVNNEVLTEERFVSLPDLSDGKIYRTGDIVRWNDSGDVEFGGRTDFQVKIKGYRIELGEIEDRMLQCPDICECVVIDRENEYKDKFLIGYYVAEKEISSEDIKNYLFDHLPSFMVPSFFVPIDSIPLTGNNKIDRKALPAVECKTDRSGKYEEPETEEEVMLVQAWKEVLKNSDIGVTDNFFMLGGDSIAAIQVSSKLNKSGYNLKVSDLFRHNTIRGVAPYLEKVFRSIDQRPVVGEIGNSPIINWFFDQDFSYPEHYNQSVMLFCQDGFDSIIVKKSFENIISHHDVLRCVVSRTGRCLDNLGVADVAFSVEVVDLTSESDPRGSIEKVAGKVQGDFDLFKGPLFNLCVFKTQEGDHLLIVMHHLVVDGVSWRILYEDFCAVYTALIETRDISLMEKTDSFKTWTDAVQQYVSSGLLNKELDYWKKVIAGDNKIVCDLPSEAEGVWADVEIEFSAQETCALLEKVHQPYNTEINDILISGLALAVGKQFDVAEFILGMEGHGRSDLGRGLELSRTVGWFTAEYPVLLESISTNTIEQQIVSVKEALHNVPQKGIGYGMLRYNADIPEENRRLLNITPEITFNYLGRFDDLDEGTIVLSSMPMGLEIHPENIDSAYINVTGICQGAILKFTFNYRKDLLNENKIQSLTKEFKEGLIDIIDHCCENKERVYTPSDFDDDLSSDELLEIQNQFKF